jgi:hypothetical protein
VERKELIAPEWIGRVTATRTLSWRQKLIAGALYRAVSDQVDHGGPAPTISGIAREIGPGSRRSVQRALEALTAAGWLERSGGVFYLVNRPETRPEPPAGAGSHDCGLCDGTGWLELVEAPAGAVAPEAPWVSKCPRCGGSGRLAGPDPGPEFAPRSDVELVAMWADSDLERRADGRLYRISDGVRVNVQPPERDAAGNYLLPPLPDGTRPAVEAVEDMTGVGRPMPEPEA